MTAPGDTAPLAHVAENKPTAAFLAEERGAARRIDPSLPGYDRFRAWFTRPLLTRPVILDAAETATLDHDLPLLLRLLQSLPERLYDGDREALARDLGWTQPSAADALRLLSGPPVPVGRADLVRSPDGFRLVEFNTSSALGSFEFGELCRAVLADPAFGGFARDHGLYHLDPMGLLGATLLDLMGRGPDDPPVVALVDWVTSPVTVNASLFIDLMRELGFRVLVCTVADLETTADGLLAHGERVDLVYRTFLFKTVAEDPDAATLLRPLAEAVREGAVHLFSPLSADLAGSKACMAMLSDPRNADRLDPAEREVVERVLPWTRSMTGADRVPHDGAGSLAEHVLRERGDLVLKPSVGHAGRGVVAGWNTAPDAWAALVRTATEGDWIVQRRAPSVAERFAGPDGELSACFLHWGLFVTGSGLSGGFVKGLPDRPQDIRFFGDGSHVGCVFHSPS